MSGKARGCPREGESSVQPYECKNMEEACDSAWLLWEATMLAAALDAYRNTNLRRDFPDFGPWAFSSTAEDGRHKKNDLRLFVGLCFRLLSLLGCQLPDIDYDCVEAAIEAIHASVVKIKVVDSLYEVQDLMLAKKSRLSFAPSVCTIALSAPAAPVAAKPVVSRKTIKEGEFLQTEERLWMTSDVRPIASHSTCPGVRWRQHQRALKSKQAELQCQVRKLKAVLPGLVEQSRRRIVELKSKVEEVRDAFPDLFPELEDILRRHAVQRERQQQLQTEIQSLNRVLEASEQRVKETTDSLAAATSLRVSTKPAVSLASVITGLQAQPDPATEAVEDSEEIPTLD
ncbi:hypothetical protein, conserved [Eimeria maxima]|uniref:Uncharacterized protein n=1 Tax=Eimeria maxima TaxID=5804 RepID=U6MCT0_EIMMA|nr:hypothetical protein, conserved [Eimeria maxima]CDJ61836.1 hypothetical protein, conserved [Eimeria maxima]